MAKARKFGLTTAYAAASKIENGILARIDRTAQMVSDNFGKTIKVNDGSCNYDTPKQASAHNLRLAR